MEDLTLYSDAYGEIRIRYFIRHSVALKRDDGPNDTDNEIIIEVSDIPALIKWLQKVEIFTRSKRMNWT